MTIGYLSGCCAVQEIRYLSRHPDGKSRMIEFCKALFTIQRFDYRTSQVVVKPFKRPVDAHYIFTGVTGYVGKERTRQDRPKYAQEFADFIKLNNLGDVIHTKSAVNRRNHPSRKIGVWIWTPAPRKLHDWWKANTPKDLTRM